ncbi:MAG TPA: ATP-binding protein [Solirubrobacteraceae bacterium]|nr:ATP-binding protein [Solirubrobacteraceae bacterium]
MAEEVLLRLELKCDERAPRVVRASLACLDEIEEVAGDLLLISSELVTNAILHSGCSRCDLLDVCLSRCEGGYMLAVTDPGHSGQTADTAAPRPAGEGGLGLRIVESLAARWGQVRERGYQVWAEVKARDAAPETRPLRIRREARSGSPCGSAGRSGAPRG